MVLFMSQRSSCQSTDGKAAAAKAFIEQANNCDVKNTKCRLAAYNKAIEAAPDLAEAYNGRALVYRENGDLDRAMSDLNKVIDLDPRAAQAYYYRAIIFTARNDLPNALDSFSKTIELLPESWAAYVGRGNAHLRSRHYQNAISDFERAMQIEPRDLAEKLKSNEKIHLLDVRTREEFEAVKIPGAQLFTQELQSKLPREELLVIYDHQGTRSMDAAAYFQGHGFTNVKSLRGGIDAYSAEVDSSLPRYHLEQA
jgi:rhodanese-related sulfurtransferase